MKITFTRTFTLRMLYLWCCELWPIKDHIILTQSSYSDSYIIHITLAISGYLLEYFYSAINTCIDTIVTNPHS
jgi:hypothetical protein